LKAQFRRFPHHGTSYSVPKARGRNPAFHQTL
jgi:hypothetical protein